jgi:hypothetical protein
VAEDTATASIYVRTDSDDTTVISPRVRVRTEALPETHVDLAYAVDVWTSASVDIVASASKAVTEQRDELNVAVDHALGDVTLAVAYRLSTEPDYVSHGGSVGGSLELANKAATLDLRVGGSRDQVSRAGDDDFEDEVGTTTAQVGFTQVLDPDTLVQVLYDLALVRGYQASAYRYVGVGGDGDCAGTAPLCIPERNPRERTRHAMALRGRRALSDEWSVGGGYRFYLDDWGVMAHTARADLAWSPTAPSSVALAYRFYAQGAADHYRERYLDADLGARYFTGDKELSTLSSHRVALEVDWIWELEGDLPPLSTALMLAPTLYSYEDFAPLDRITAFEVTAVIGMEAP